MKFVASLVPESAAEKCLEFCTRYFVCM